MSRVVADTTGTNLIGFWNDRGEVNLERYPVIAWIIHDVGDEGAEPVICEARPEVYCLELTRKGVGVEKPFCVYVFPDLAVCDTWASAVKYAKDLVKAQEEAVSRARAAAQAVEQRQ